MASTLADHFSYANHKPCTVLGVSHDTVTLSDEGGREFAVPKHLCLETVAVGDLVVVTVESESLAKRAQGITAKALLNELLKDEGERES